jgi:hypothetical protein
VACGPRRPAELLPGTVVVCGGAERGAEMLGRSLVAPGRLQDGHCAVADLQRRSAELEAFGALACGEPACPGGRHLPATP